jgi:hypothetical protein
LFLREVLTPLENHYINPLLLNVEEEKLMKIKVFG